jgi:hypothetical protein
VNKIPCILCLSQSQYDRRVVGTSPVAEVDNTVTGIQMLNAAANAFQNFKYGTNTGSWTNTTSSYGPLELAVKDLRDFLGVSQLHVVQVSKGGVSLHPTATAGGLAGSFFYDTEQVTGANKLFDVQYSRIEQAVQIMGDQGNYLDWKCVIVGQGESDQGAPYNSFYSAYFTEWMRRTYSLLGKTLPTSVLGITSASDFYDATVRTAQTDWVAANSANGSAFIDTNGFPLQADDAHYNATGVGMIRSELFEWLKDIW